MPGLRRNWFVEFERSCRSEFAAAFRGRRHDGWRLTVDEGAWTVHAWLPDSDAPVLSETLPCNYLLFRPGTVADNIVTRLWEKARALAPVRRRIAG